MFTMSGDSNRSVRKSPPKVFSVLNSERNSDILSRIWVRWAEVSVRFTAAGTLRRPRIRSFQMSFRRLTLPWSSSPTFFSEMSSHHTLPAVAVEDTLSRTITEVQAVLVTV